MKTAKIIYGDGTTDRMQFMDYQAAHDFAYAEAKRKNTIVRYLSYIGG